MRISVKIVIFFEMGSTVIEVADREINAGLMKLNYWRKTGKNEI